MNKTAKSADKEIICLYTAGNKEKALELFVSVYQEKLYSLAYKMLSNHEDAMDALQEIFIQVNRSLINFRGESQLYTWVYRVASNVCINYCKKRKPCDKLIEWDEQIINATIKPMERPIDDPDKMCEEKYKQFLLQQALLKLPTTQRAILILHELKGFSSPEVAQMLDKNINTVKSQIHRGKKKLKDIISKGFKVKGMDGIGVCTVSQSGQLI